ncbi:MAG TPA: YraN family protein [Candidatus Binataceae bacterium]
MRLRSLLPERSERSCARLALGRKGEKIAERHLKRRGYRIIARNYRVAGGEIDLVAMDGDTLVFVEVKTRHGRGAGMPEEAVDARKQNRMRRAAEFFALQYRAGERAMRFDVVAIIADGRKHQLELLKDAF